jgi:hypothetical protein
MKNFILAVIFFVLGVATTILYNFYDMYKWQLKAEVYLAMHTLKQVSATDNYDDAILQLRRNVACTVDNYVLRNEEAGLEVDKKFVEDTLAKVKVTCEPQG